MSRQRRRRWGVNRVDPVVLVLARMLGRTHHGLE